MAGRAYTPDNGPFGTLQFAGTCIAAKPLPFEREVRHIGGMGPDGVRVGALALGIASIYDEHLVHLSVVIPVVVGIVDIRIRH